MAKAALKLFACIFASLFLTASIAAESSAPVVTYRIKPSETNAAIVRADAPHLVMFRQEPRPQLSNLLLFLPGTTGKPRELTFFPGLVAAGYRLISLAYDDDQAVQQLCFSRPDPTCAAKVRRKRIYGNDVTDLIDDTPSEAIVSRLTSLLSWLDKQYPDQHWDAYLANGAPDWSRIAVSGQSQGAGMAAFIAKEHAVPRVVLFSSPWDNFGRMHTLAPWLSKPSATPPERWFASYHAKERTAPAIARAYAALEIPEEHIRVLTMEPMRLAGANPYHGVGISNVNTPDNFSFMFGSGYAASP